MTCVRAYYYTSQRRDVQDSKRSGLGVCGRLRFTNGEWGEEKAKDQKGTKGKEKKENSFGTLLEFITRPLDLAPSFAETLSLSLRMIEQST
jgi:hypothetical protein